jgi:hypothetical protein
VAPDLRDQGRKLGQRCVEFEDVGREGILGADRLLRPIPDVQPCGQILAGSGKLIWCYHGLSTAPPTTFLRSLQACTRSFPDEVALELRQRRYHVNFGDAASRADGRTRLRLPCRFGASRQKANPKNSKLAGAGSG